MYQWPLHTWLTCWNCLVWRILNQHQPLEHVLFPKFNLNHWTEISAPHGRQSVVASANQTWYCICHFKELSRDLTAPTTARITTVKHLLKYIAGTKDHCQRLCPNVTLESSNCTLDLDCYVDSHWAGCRSTRKSTSGTVVQIWTIALSSGEAELYAIGQGTSEALYIRNLITEAKLAKIDQHQCSYWQHCWKEHGNKIWDK